MNKFEDIYKQILTHTSEGVGYEILLDPNITTDKIDYYVDNFTKETILESFSAGVVDVEYINKEGKDTNGVSCIKDRFKFSVNDKIFYFVDVTYYKSEDFLPIFDRSVLSGYGETETFNRLTTIKSYLKNNTNKYVTYFDFKTKDIEYKLTGNVSRLSYNVFGSVVRAMRQSLFHNSRFPNICMVYFISDKTESKRLPLYSKIVNSELTGFNNRFVDSYTNEKYYKIYYWR